MALIPLIVVPTGKSSDTNDAQSFGLVLLSTIKGQFRSCLSYFTFCLFFQLKLFIRLSLPHKSKAKPPRREENGEGRLASSIHWACRPKLFSAVSQVGVTCLRRNINHFFFPFFPPQLIIFSFHKCNTRTEI